MKPKIKNNKFLIWFMLIIYVIGCLIILQTNSVITRNAQMIQSSTSLASNTKVSLVEAISTAISEIFSMKVNIFPITSKGIQILLGYTLTFALALVYMIFDAEKNRRDAVGIESGSAKWNTDMKAYNKKYSDPINSVNNDGEYNMIWTKNVFLNMNTYQTNRNNNGVVIGGTGTGKSRFVAKPNILQANCSMVITDPAGELLRSTGSFLESQGYKIKVFNLVEMKHSNCYNPFNYIRDDLGVLILINCLIKNTTPANARSSDPFWEKSETALLQALIFYLIKYRPKHEQNFTSVMKLLRAARVDENNANEESALDKIFKEVARKDPNSIALKQYMVFRQAPERTLMSILVSAAVRLTAFNIVEIENLTSTDNIDLGSLGDEKQALFVIIPTADDTYNFLVSMMYTQLFETLYYHAENECENEKLPHHVRFILDEFANIGQIPDFDKKLATMRKYEISSTIILQNLSQLKKLYKDSWEDILSNCDSFLFLGGQEYSTLEYISNELGNATITVRDTGLSSGKSKSSSKNFKKTARKLMTPDELLVMDNSDCILIIRGLRPFYDKKYDYLIHKNYKYTGDADMKNKYPYRDKFNNEKKDTPEELSMRIKAQRAAQIKSAIDLDTLDAIGVSYGPIDQEFMKAIGAKTHEEIKDKFAKKKTESEIDFLISDDDEEIVYTTKN